MSAQDVGWSELRQDVLQAADDGQLFWRNPGGLGGFYLHRGETVLGRRDKHPVLLLKDAEALVHGDSANGAGMRPVLLTDRGRQLLTKWRARKRKE